MEALPNWLPKIEPFEEYNNDWQSYCDALYQIFRRDFIENITYFRDQKVGLKRMPIEQGKESTFWHITSKGEEEADRKPDFRRCERIRWPKPIIENHSDDALKIWTEKRNGEHRIHIWLQADGYLIVLNRRKGYLILWTAFHVARERQKEKYLRRWERNREI